MSTFIAHYGVLSHYPRPHRTEHVHIGLVVFLPDQSVRVHLAEDLKKLRTMDPTTDFEAVRSWETGLPKLLNGMSADRAAAFVRDFGQWSLSEALGSFTFDSEEQYLARVAHALRNLVAAPMKSLRERQDMSRLHVDLKIVFQSKGWLGRDIRNHEIVERHPLGPMTTAEFALQNGRLHVIETLDLRTSNVSAKKSDARSKALTLDMARRAASDSARFAIVAGIDSPLLADAKDLLSGYCDHVLQWENVPDMNGLMSELGTATGKPGLPIPY
jgi:hypothetical protein